MNVGDWGKSWLEISNSKQHQDAYNKQVVNYAREYMEVIMKTKSKGKVKPPKKC